MFTESKNSMKKLKFIMPLTLILSACKPIDLETHNKVLEKTLSAFNVNYSEYICEWQNAWKANCFVSNSNRELTIFTCEDYSCHLDFARNSIKFGKNHD